jgi:hypothetical protein
VRVKANVILAKCRTEKQLYGMRVQEVGGDWVRTWAFPIREELAVQEGFDKVSLQGSFGVTEDYPGCPYCGTKMFFVCGACGKLNCYHGEKITKCLWCMRSAETESKDTLDVTGGGY